MKRLRGHGLGAAVALALAGAAMACAVWAVATTSGTRWLLSTIPPLAGISFSAQKIEGRIIDQLQLTHVRLGLGLQKIELDGFRLSWKPLLLLAGTVAVQELTIDGVRIQDSTPPDNKPPNLAWPRVTRRAQLFDGRIARLTVTNLDYRRLQEQPLRVTSCTASVTWQDDILSVNDLAALSPAGRISGTVAAGFNQPSLTADLAITPTHPVAKMDTFSLQVRRGSGRGPERFVGLIAIAGSSGTHKLAELSGEVGMARSAFNLRQLRLSRPGRKGELRAEGSLEFTKKESLLTLQISVTGLDLAPELHVPTNLSGTLKFTGSLDNYRGDFTLANQARGWQALTVSAAYRGTAENIKLSPIRASLLDGSLAGKLDLDWRDGLALQGSISGKNLNPARLDPDWQGVVNLSAAGSLAWSGKAPVTGNVRGTLLESSLHGQALTGELQADVAGANLSLARLVLQGKGFALQASGRLDQRLDLSARISDFSRLVPGSAGTLQTEGWVRRQDGQLSGDVTGTGNGLAYAGTRIADATLSARREQGADSPLHVSATLRDVVHDRYALHAVTLTADGSPARHAVNAALRFGDSEVRLAMSAGYNAGVWQGEINRLSGRDPSGPWKLSSPTAFVVSADKFVLSPLAISAGSAESLELAADLALTPLSGQVRAHWSGLNLARATPFLTDGQITGSSNGTIRLDVLAEKRLSLTGSAAGSGTFTRQGQSVTVKRSLVTFDGGAQGMRASVELATSDGGSLKGSFSSPAPLRPTLPEKGDLTMEVSGIDLARFTPWLPRDIRLEGRINGRAKGILLPGQRFELDGTAALSGGTLHRSSPAGEMKLTFTSAAASWGWRGETLNATLSLNLSDYGQAQTNLQLPLAARFPLVVNPKGPLRAALSGKFQETGIVTALFPGLVQESSGELDTELAVSGTWDVPIITGKLRLTKAGAYLPTAGIRLQDVQLAARLEKDLIRIDSFRARSGPGHIEGTAFITLAGWRVTGYRGTIGGENFQTVHFPEVSILSTPKLTFVGTPQKLTLRGELRLPELNINGAPSRSVIAPSGDVILEGKTVPAAKESPLALDVQARVLLGERVFVKVAGIDAQLGGAMDLSLNSLDRITSSGEIKVIKGRYRTYGVNLEIVRGRLFFAGGAIDRPTLDFLALRTIGDVRAGVTVAGTLQKPVTKLYSEPAMPDVDVLAYVVLGHPIGSSSGEQAGLMAQAAGALLTSSQSAVLQDQIKNKLGLSTLEIQGGVGGTPGAMGYKPLQVTPPGSLPAVQQPGITQTMLTVGKYLTPQLYVSYGKSLFTGNNQFRLRYDIFKRLQIETQTGSESGADLYYKLEFK